MIRHVLFDAVGTVIYSAEPVPTVYQRIASKHGCDVPADAISTRFRAALRQAEEQGAATNEEIEWRKWQSIVASVFPDAEDPEPIFEELWRYFAKPQHWRMFDDVATSWERLRDREIPVHLASNFDERLHRICSAQSLLSQGGQIFTSSRLGWPKPHPQFFFEVEQTLQASGADLLMVGDDLENDYHAPRKAGWRAVWLRRDLPANHLDSESIGSLHRLADWIERYTDSSH